METTNIAFAMYCIFAVSAIGCLIITFFTSGSAAWGSQIAGYCVFAIAMIMLFANVVVNSSNADASTTPTNKFYIFGIGIYLLIMFATIGCKLYGLFAYKDRIISNGQYYSYFNIPILGLIVLQFFLLFNFFSQKSLLNAIVLSFLCLLGLLNLIATIIDFNVLSYYYADGFCSVSHT